MSQKSKWAKWNGTIDPIIKEGRTDWFQMARDVMEKNNFKYTQNDTHQLRKYIQRRKNNILPELKNETKPNDYNSKPFIMSAFNNDKGKMMGIDEYCEHYNLPRADISSYKLISHTGTPFYNIVFKENLESFSIDYEGGIEGVINKMNFNRIAVQRIEDKESEDLFTRLVYTDVHIGMETNPEGIAMYPIKWEREDILESIKVMSEQVLKNKVGQELYIDELGDYLDGFNGETTRKGHHLPQNMSNQQAFEVGLEMKLTLINLLAPHFNKVVCHNITNDNHAGDWGANLNHAFKVSAESIYDNVEVINMPEFLNHYTVGEHAFVLSHGKDKRNLKFGFKPQLDTKQIEKIDQYLKYHGIFNKSQFIEINKGDSHVMLFDYSTAQDFDYMNIAALSPSSDWVQTNFKRGERGFLIQKIDKEKRNKVQIPIFL